MKSPKTPSFSRVFFLFLFFVFPSLFSFQPYSPASVFAQGNDLVLDRHSNAFQEIKGLVPVKEVDPSIVIELRYATAGNFTGKKIYPVDICILRRETAQKLAGANAEFEKDGYRIKIWDAYRPPYVQKIFWDILPDERFVANPNKGGSRHNRGSAVDMTLVDNRGREIEMPSAFDDFSPTASPDSPAMSPRARKNLDYLTRVLKRHGFIPIKDEWWHFDDSDWQKFPIVDVRLEEFLKLKEKLSAPAGTFLPFLKEETRQAIIVREMARGGFKAKLTAWELTDGTWRRVCEPMNAVLGKNGLAAPGQKREGDGKTPSGVFDLKRTFGYHRIIFPSSLTALLYRRAGKDDYWVDDPESSQYNQWVKGRPQAKSFEKLKRSDDLYKYAIVVEYNTEPVVPGLGSAIFLHIWRDAESSTAGCVAVSEKNILYLLGWLDKTRCPVIILEGSAWEGISGNEDVGIR